MKIKELIKELEMFDGNLEVYCSCDENIHPDPKLKLDEIETYISKGMVSKPVLML